MAKRKILTELTVTNWKAANARQEVPDPSSPGLYLVVQPSGLKSFAFRYRFEGKSKKLTVGRYGKAEGYFTLGEARAKVSEWLGEVQRGIDPSVGEQAIKDERKSGRNTVAAQIEVFDKRHLSKLKSGKAVRQSLDYNVVPQWGRKEVSEITKRDVVNLLDGLVDAGKGTTANRVKAYLSKFFGWCVDRGLLEQSPVMGVKAPVGEAMRDRPLSDDEVSLLWMACEAEGVPWGRLFQVLLLTGQRRGEVCRMKFGDIDENGVWTITNTKNRSTHKVPLPRLALDIIDAQPRIGRDGWVFTTTGTAPCLSLFKPHKRLLAAMGEDVPHWSPHDIRHTVKTGLSRLGVPHDIRSRATNHLSELGPMERRYNHDDFIPQVREALEKWSSHIAGLQRVRIN